MTEECVHPLLVPDDGSLRYFYCVGCRRTLRLITFGPNAPEIILIGSVEELK